MSKAILFLFAFLPLTMCAQQPQNWTGKQLMQPAELAKVIGKKDQPVTISVGPAALIPNSVDVGMTNDAEGVSNLKKELAKLPKDKEVVIYCGCCPFAHCPNVRPAIAALKELKFTNYYLLNLPNNIRTDWINKGYPTNK
ncbi:MAG: rhodanese-like domain-containing protein [Flavisolibacter sp.]